MESVNNFEEALIPRFVWDFAKKVLKNPISAGILALIVWNFIKNKQKNVKESLSVDDWQEVMKMVDDSFCEDQKPLGVFNKDVQFTIKGKKIVPKMSSPKDENEYSFTMSDDKKTLIDGELNGRRLPSNVIDKWEKQFKNDGLLER
jgi:hypothetical protein